MLARVFEAFLLVVEKCSLIQLFPEESRMLQTRCNSSGFTMPQVYDFECTMKEPFEGQHNCGRQTNFLLYVIVLSLKFTNVGVYGRKSLLLNRHSSQLN